MRFIPKWSRILFAGALLSANAARADDCAKHPVQCCVQKGNDILSCVCQNGGPCEGALFSLDCAGHCDDLALFDPNGPAPASLDFFDAKGNLLYTDNAVFPIAGKGDQGGITVMATANLNGAEFDSVYRNPASFLQSTGLTLRLYQVDGKGARKATPLIVGPDLPFNRALFAEHSGDTPRLQAAIDAETAARVAADQSLAQQIAADDAGEVHKTGNETISGQKSFIDLVVGTITSAMNFLGPLMGDVSGSQLMTEVVALRGVPIDTLAPLDNMALVYDGKIGRWTPRLLCAGILQDCNHNPFDGCEANVLADTANCGLCGRACAMGQKCQSGACVAQMQCPAGLTSCNGQCVDENSNPANCGACGIACPMGTVCNAGKCTQQCKSLTCMDQNFGCGFAGDGCGNKIFCGNCPQGQACGANNQCQGMGQICGNPGQPCCAMGAACLNPNSTCSMGVCVACGGTGQACCNGINCLGGDVCQNGVCVQQGGCAANQTQCGNACVNTGTDPNNCGACGRACFTPNAIPGCSLGKCVVLACNPGFADCNGNPFDGCEVNVTVDRNNCGACGIVCMNACAGGKCM